MKPSFYRNDKVGLCNQLLRFTAAFLLLGTISLAGEFAHAKLAEVTLVRSPTFADLPDAEARAALQKYGIVPLSVKDYPGLKGTDEKIQKLLQKLILEKDGDAPIRLIVSDSFEVNACFIRPKDSAERIVVVNAGLLDFVKSDDELAFVLGHELEHGTSQIESALAEVAKERGTTQTEGEQLVAALTKRTIENEVDVKSAINRVHEKGMNAGEARNFFIRLREQNGDRTGKTHTLLGTRLNTMDSATSLLTRGAGEQIVTGTTHDIVNEHISQSLTSEKAKALQLKKIEAVLKRPVLEFETAFQSILAPDFREGPGLNNQEMEFKKRFADLYKNAFEKRSREIRRHLSRAFTPEEKLAHSLSLQKSLAENLIESRNRHLPPEVIGKLNAVQVKAWWALENPNTEGTLTDDFGDPLILKKINSFKENEAKLAKIHQELSTPGVDEKIRTSNESLKTALENQQKALAERIQVLRTAYQPGKETDRLIEQYAKILRLKVGNQYPYLLKAELFYPLKEKEIITGRTFDQSFDFKAKYSKQNAQRMGASFLSPEFQSSLETSVEARFKMTLGPKVNYEEFHGDLVKGYLQEWKKAFRAASPEIQQRLSAEAAQVLSQAYPAVLGELTDALKANKNHYLNRAITGYLDELTKSAKNYEAIQNGFLKLGEMGPRNTRPMAPDRFMNRHFISSQQLEWTDRTNKLLVWGKETADQLLNSPTGITYFQKRMDLLAAKIKEGVPKEEIIKLLDKDLDGFRALLGSSASGSRLAQAPGIQKSFDQLMEAASSALASSPKHEDTLRVALKTRYFDDIWTKAALGSPAHSVDISDLRSQLSKNPLLQKDLKGAFRFDGLFTATKNQSRKDLYAFAAEFPDAFGGSNYIELPISDQSGVHYYERRNEFAAWSANQGPQQRQAALQRVNDRSPGNVSESGILEAPKYEAAKARYNASVVEIEVAKFKKDPKSSRYADFFENLRISGIEDIQAASALNRSTLGLQDRIKLVRAQQENLIQHGVYGYLSLPDGEDLANTKSLRKSRAEALMDGLRLNPKEIAGLPARENAQVLSLLFEIGTSSHEQDELFNQLFEKKMKGASLDFNFQDEALVQKLYYEGSKENLARWQLENKHHLSDLGTQARKANLTLEHLRPEVEEIKKTIQAQYPSLSTQRDSLINFVESKITTTQAENKLFNSIKIGAENWASSSQLAYIDFPTKISNHFRSNFDRLEMIQYLTHHTNEMPQFYRNAAASAEAHRAGYGAQMFEELRNVKKRFAQSDVHSRNFLLMPLLDEKKGALSEAPIRQKINEMLLGQHSENPLYKSLFEAYVESVPVSEQKIVYGQILASLVERQGAGASIATVLEAMGPLGIKAGQFIRTSGLATPEISKELDGFLDRSLEPTRKKVLDDVHRIFEKQLSEIISIGELKGSGSINYAVRVKLKNKNGGDPVEALISIQRDAVEGKVGNENQVWQKAIEKLKKDSHQDVRKLANLVEEARANAYETLKPGGLELDHGIQRANYPAAQATYGRGNTLTESGFEITAVKPIDAYQDLIPPELQAKFSVYEYVPTTSWEKMKDLKLRAKLARDVMKTELEAIKSGTFDRDGHRGNWLIDETSNKLVRIDYPQLESFPPDEIEAFLSAIKVTANPWMGTLDASKLAPALEKVFSITGAPQKINPAWIRNMIASPDFPVNGNAQERIFFFRQELETLLAKNGKNVSVRLGATSRSALMSFSKIMQYEEYMSPRDFKALLANQLDLTLPEMALSRMKRPVGKVLNLMENCASGISGTLKALFPK